MDNYRFPSIALQGSPCEKGTKDALEKYGITKNNSNIIGNVSRPQNIETFMRMEKMMMKTNQ